MTCPFCGSGDGFHRIDCPTPAVRFSLGMGTVPQSRAVDLPADDEQLDCAPEGFATLDYAREMTA